MFSRVYSSRPISNVNYVALLLLFAQTVDAKGKTSMIEVSGKSLSSTIAISDANIIDKFNIWNGPGVSTRSLGIPDPPAYLDPDKTQGRFIDWPKGMVATTPEPLLRFDVAFYIEGFGKSKSYRIVYAFDPGERNGYVYLPACCTDLIVHGVEGNWFHATSLWNELMMPLTLRGGD